jgi:uncharacterized membrane protein
MLVLLLAVHDLAAVFWVGGMAFAYLILRPAAGPLEPAPRLGLWRRALGRFLPWVAIAVIALLVSGYGLIILLGGFDSVGLYVHLMQATGILMMLLFCHLFFAAWPRFRRAVDSKELPEAAKNLNQIRMVVAINLALGVITILVGSTGRYW